MQCATARLHRTASPRWRQQPPPASTAAAARAAAQRPREHATRAESKLLLEQRRSPSPETSIPAWQRQASRRLARTNWQTNLAG